PGLFAILWRSCKCWAEGAMPYVELLSAIVFDHASWDAATGTINPAIVVRGELPAGAEPFVVDRVYQGPQGAYDESFALLDPRGDVVHQHGWGRVTLRGEMFEDRFRDVVRAHVAVANAEEHALVLLVNDYEVGRIPVFIEAPDSAVAAGVLADVLDATLKKSAIVWLTIPQPQGEPITKPAWFVYQGGKVYVLTGPAEQDLTNIARAGEVTLTARSKEVRSQIASVPAHVRVVSNDSDEFDQVIQVGLTTRLNLPDGDAALERWKQTCTLVELSPQA
ncbi:MAG: hypothetical protein M3133_04570, partial [Actinomycetota bacterium]|nr:hypothetical protein [Actinomycetota bacterium]